MCIMLQNKKVQFEYFIEQKFEVGMCLEGWEVKSLRANLGSIKESYCIIKNEELFVIGMNITPLTNSFKFNVDPIRSRKLKIN